MKRPAFNVTSGVVLVLSGIGLLSVLAQPYLPKSESDRLITLVPNEQLPAPVIDMNWQPTPDLALQTAKREKKGVLIFLASPTNRRSRELETVAFRDSEVVRFIRRNFIAAKVNLDTFGEFENFAFPLTRATTPHAPGVGLLILNSKGKLVDAKVYRFPQPPAKEFIQGFLLQAKKEIDLQEINSEYESDPMKQQAKDRNRLAGFSENPIPDFNGFATQFIDQLSPLEPFNKLGIVSVKPLTIRFLNRINRTSDSSRIAKATMLSPLFDPIDGGFFQFFEIVNRRQYLDTEKRSAQNALWAEILAEQYRLTEDPIYRLAASTTAACLMQTMVFNDQVVAGIPSDISANNKSYRNSLSQSKMGSILSERDRIWVESNLLQRRDNPYLLPQVTRLETFTDPNYERIRNILRLRLPRVPNPSREDKTSTSLTTAARLIRTGVLLDRPDFIELGQRIFDAFRATFDDFVIYRFSGRIDGDIGWLNSYLAYSDCALQSYLATGRIEDLTLATRVFQLTLQKFMLPDLQMLGSSPAGNSLISGIGPQIVDIDGESSISVSMRIASALSFLAREPSLRFEFRQYTSGVASKLAPLLTQASPEASGYYSEAIQSLRPYAVICDTQSSIEDTNILSRSMPLVPIFPMVTGLRSDWNRTAKGYFLIQGEQRKGPFTLQQMKVELAKIDLTLP
jgi:hypothetical protein